MFFGHFVKKQRIDGQVSVYPLQIRVYSLYGSQFPGSRRPVQPSCVSNTPLPGWGFRRLRTAGTVSKRIDTPYGGFYPLGTPSSALFGSLGATERKRSYLEVGPKKENGSTVITS